MTSTGTGRAARVGVATAFAAVTVGLLQGLQSAVGSFNPRWQVTALIAVAVLAGSLALQRLRGRLSENADAADMGALVQRSVAAWPIPGLEEADPVELGVFPTRRDEGQEADYIPRTLDGKLLEALRQSPFVLVIGPARAGKSRTALECARQALGDDVRAVIAPRDAEALEQLLDVDPRLSYHGLTAGRRVLWLEDVERFVGAVDAEMLDRLGRPEELAGEVDPAVTVIATAREDGWRRLLEAGGAKGEAVKAIVARARVLELPLELDPERELPEATRLYPRRDFARGIGQALTSSGTEAPFPETPDAPRSRSDGQKQIGGPPPAERDWLLLAPAFLAVAAMAVVGVLLLTGDFEKPKPLTIAQQAAKARKKGSAGPRTVIDTERVDFHGSGERSYVYAFGDSSGSARSHELQVWDQHGDELRREFRFEPREEAIFQFRFIGDVDGDGAEELIGGFGDRAILGELLLPFALDWDEDAEDYKLISLAPRAAKLDSRARSADVKGLRSAYRSPFRLHDVEGEHSLAGYRSQDFDVAPRPHRLINAYVADIDAEKQERLVEMQSHSFDRTRGSPGVRRCRLNDMGVLLSRVPSARRRSLHRSALARWLELSKDRFCVVFD